MGFRGLRREGWMVWVIEGSGLVVGTWMGDITERGRGEGRGKRGMAITWKQCCL